MFHEWLESSGCSSPVVEACSALYEAATGVLYHFATPERFLQIAETNSFTPSDVETDLNGEGVRSISFSRTKSFREGFPVLMHSYEFPKGSDWCAIRLTMDGDAMNRYSTFKVNGERRNYKIRPFDWAYNNYGTDFGENFDISDRVDTGKEWMLKSDAVNKTYYPMYNYGDGGLSVDFSDKESHPYAQAEDRLTTTSDTIPGADRLIRHVDIVVDPAKFSKQNFPLRKRLYKVCTEGRLKGRISLFLSVHMSELNQKSCPPGVLLYGSNWAKRAYSYLDS